MGKKVKGFLSDTMAVYRTLVFIMLFVIMFFICWNIEETRNSQHETKVNRGVGQNIAAVNCALLKSQVIDGDVGSNDDFLVQVFKDNCESGAVYERYPNVRQ